MGFQVVFALKVRCTALEPRVWSEMVCFLLSAFSFPLQMVPSGRRGLTSWEDSEGVIARGGGVLISRVVVLDFRYRPVNDFKRQMLSTRVPKWWPFAVFWGLMRKWKSCSVSNGNPSDDLCGHPTIVKKHSSKTLRKNMHFCKTWFTLDFKWSPRSLIILMRWCPKPHLEGRNDPQRFRKHSKWALRVQKCAKFY